METLIIMNMLVELSIQRLYIVYSDSESRVYYTNESLKADYTKYTKNAGRTRESIIYQAESMIKYD